MFTTAKTSILIFLFGICYTHAELRNDLRITGGTCITPEEENCFGLDTTGEFSRNIYRKLGRTVSEARRNDWEKWSWSKSCENEGLYRGFQWIDPTEPLSVVLLFDIQETIAGIQFWIPQDEVPVPPPFQYESQPVMRNATVGGRKYYYITVYFTNPNFICTQGRSVQDLNGVGTITELYIQEGPYPKLSRRVSLTKQKALQEGWGNCECQNSMGWRSFFDRQTQERDGCRTFNPLFILFDNNGNLNGLGFMVAGKLSAPSLERLSTSKTDDIGNVQHKCISDLNGQYDISSLHVFFSNDPYNFKCADGSSIPYPTPVDPIERSKFPVCVIGAGMSGLGVAVELEKKGYPVEIFEKTSRLGGKVHTFRQGEDVLVDMCPLLISPKSYRLAKYIDDFNLTRDYFNEKDRKGYSYDTMVPMDIPLPPDVNEIVQEAKRYIELHEKYKKELQYGYVNSSPDLHVSIYDWLRANQFGQSMMDIMSLLITTQGYGALEDIPALYVLQLLDKYKMQGLIKPQTEAFFVVKEGLETLVGKIASTLKSKIYLNHQVSHIERLKNHQVVHFNDGIETRLCSKVILAFPPLLTNVQKIMALTPFEKNVLADVKINRYISGAHHIPPWNSSMYLEAFTHPIPGDSRIVKTRPMGTGEPVVFLRQDAGKMSNIYSSYSWIRGSFDSVAPQEDLDMMTRKLNAALLRVDSNAITFDQDNPEYFPHATPAALQNGFYKKFSQIQGHRGVYYATTLLTFEIMEKALEMGATLVHKYF